MIFALETLSFGLFLIGWLLLGACGTWTETVPFWLGAPFMWLSAICGLFTIHWGLRGHLSRASTVSVILFTGYILWRALQSDVAYLARTDAVFCATAFIAWAMTAARFEKPRHRFTMLIVWGLLIGGNLILGLRQLYYNPHANPLSFLGVSRDLSDAVFGGFFPNSNHLCGFMELTALPMLAMAVFGRIHSFVRVLCALAFIAGGVAVALSTSRGGLSFGVGLVVFAGIAGILHIKRGGGMKGKSGSTPALFLVLVLVCSGVGWLTWNRLESYFGKGNVFNNLNGRTELWSRAAEQWQESPIIGTGARSFEYYEQKYRDLKTPWITWSETDVNAVWAHNDWVQILADYGLIGLFLAALVLGIHSWRALHFIMEDSARAKREGGGFFTDYRGALTLGALSGIAAFAIHCMADFQMHVGVNAVLAAALLGLMANPGTRDVPDIVAERSDERLARPVVAWRAAVTVCAAVPATLMGIHVVPWAVGDYTTFSASSIYSSEVKEPAEFLIAGAMFKAATEWDSVNYHAWRGLAVAHSGSAQMDLNSEDFRTRAFECFAEAHRLYPQNSDISVNAARTLDALGRFQEAEEWYVKRALPWGNGSRLVHWWYGDHLKAMKRYAEALTQYRPVAEKHKIGGWKRTAITRSIQYCERMLKEEEAKKNAAAPTPPAAPPAPAPNPAPPPR